MRINYNSEFKEFSQNPAKHFKIDYGYFRDIKGNTIKTDIQCIYDQDADKSRFFVDPSEINWSELELDFNDYTSLDIYYTDPYTNNTSIAISLSPSNVFQEFVLEKNLIEISDTGWSGFLDPQSHNYYELDFLESQGLMQDCSSIFSQKDSDTSFITKESYQDYIRYKKRKDSLDHNLTTYINEYGLKTY